MTITITTRFTNGATCVTTCGTIEKYTEDYNWQLRKAAQNLTIRTVPTFGQYLKGEDNTIAIEDCSQQLGSIAGYYALLSISLSIPGTFWFPFDIPFVINGEAFVISEYK